MFLCSLSSISACVYVGSGKTCLSLVQSPLNLTQYAISRFTACPHPPAHSGTQLLASGCTSCCTCKAVPLELEAALCWTPAGMAMAGACPLAIKCSRASLLLVLVLVLVPAATSPHSSRSCQQPCVRWEQAEV
jgi:hypothetical protein